MNYFKGELTYRLMIVPMIFCVVILLNADKTSSLNITRIFHLTMQFLLMYGLFAYLSKYKYLRAIFALVVILSMFSVLSYNSLPSAGMIISILNSPVEEAHGFIKFHWLDILISITLFLGLVFLPVPENRLLNRISILTGLIYITIPSLVFALGDETVPNSYIKAGLARDMSQFEIKLEYVYSHEMGERFPVLKSVKGVVDTIRFFGAVDEGNESSWRKVNVSDTSPDLLIIGLGESLRADHMQIYGYERNTTPLLSAMRNKLFIYEAAYSGGTNTWTSVPSMFTKFGSRPDLSKSIINLANDAGYTTYWLSNQTKTTNRDFFVSSIALQSKHVFFSANEDTSEIRHDELLLPRLLGVLKNRRPEEKTLIVLHFYGSHMDFKDRYPVKYAKYNGGKNEQERKNNEYDNSILYTDYVLSELFEISYKYNARFIYFSDHGLGNKEGDIPLKHDAREKPDIDSIHVPLISSHDLNLDTDKPVSLFYFECIFSDWSGITAEELSTDYCNEALGSREIVFYDSNLSLNKIHY